MFNSLHVHTSRGSFMDSMVKIPELIAKVKEYGMTHCAITDHGSMSGVVDFYDEATKQGIVPIIGCEFYISAGSRTDTTANRNHIIVLAKNKKGYDNLVKLATISNQHKYMNRGCIDDEVLVRYKNGLIILTACLSGKIPQAILAGDMALASKHCEYYKKEFGTDFFLELMDNKIKEQYVVNDGLEKLSKKHKISIVATNDVHYINKEDADSHDILKRIHYNRKEASGFDGEGYFFRRKEDFDKKYHKYCDTDCVTSKIQVYSIYENKKDEFFMPVVPNASATLEMEASKGLIARGHSGNKVYEERIRSELKIINDLGFPDYFLIVQEAIQWCRNEGIIVGAGRGSAGGSLVAYCLGITDFDPMNEQCPLYFERFLNPHRVSPPDIDTDLTDRDRVIEHIREKYGPDKVVHIGVTTTLATKDVINNIARVTNVQQFEIKALLDLIPTDTANTSNKDLYETNDAYKALINSKPVLREIHRHAVKLEGLYKNASVHASGIIISSRPINIPMNTYKGTVFTQYDMWHVEKLGYIKFDFLGLKTLSILEKTLNKIGGGVSLRDIDYWHPDKKTMKLINDCKTTCVFQWESDGYRNLISRLHPDTLSELVDLNTLYRPGPMESGMTDQYIHRKQGREPVKPIHPLVEGLFKRQGLPLFQEEIMKMCQVVAGFTMAEADMIRKAIGKKKKDLLDEQEKKFIDGCLRNNVDLNDAQDLWEKLQKFSRYSWNLSHGLAYTIISYWTAYFSAHYPAEFFSANMDVHSDNFDRLLVIINEARNRGIEVVSPDINASTSETTVVDGKIYMTFGAIRGIGPKVEEAILQERTKGPFKDFRDFCDRVPKNSCNSEAKERLIYAGVFDGLYKDAGDIMSIRVPLLESNVNKKNKAKVDYIENISTFKLIKEEFDRIGIYIKDTPIDLLKMYVWDTNVSAVEIIDIHKHTDKNGRKMAFITATDYRTRKFDFVVFSSLYKDIEDYLKKGAMVLVGYRDQDSNRGQVVENMLPIVIDGEVNEMIYNYLLPVVSLKTEQNNKLTFSRYIAHEDENGVVVLYYKEGFGQNVHVALRLIEGYKLKG